MANHNFDFRMEDPNSGHYQEGTIQVTDEEVEASEEYNTPKDLAKAILLGRQQRNADYRLTTDEFFVLCKEVYPTDDDAAKKLADQLINYDESADDGMSREEFLNLPGKLRAAVVTHHQPEPYTMKSFKEVG